MEYYLAGILASYRCHILAHTISGVECGRTVVKREIPIGGIPLPVEIKIAVRFVEL